MSYTTRSIYHFLLESNMTNYKLPKVFYHATLYKHLDSINERIKIHLPDAKINTDFGKGFYTTSSYQQALERAQGLQEFHRDKRNGTIGKPNKGAIVTFALDTELMYNVPIDQRAFFSQPNEEWAEYIVFNRLNRQPISPYKYKWTYGPLADGKMLRRSCMEYQKQNIKLNELILSISPHSAEYHQLSFHEDEDFVNKALTIEQNYVLSTVAASKGG